MMTRISKERRLPAEWESYEAVLISWPHAESDWAYMLEEVQTTVLEIIRVITSEGLFVVLIAPDTSDPKARLSAQTCQNVLFFDVPTNDTWTRDYGVITCVDGNGGKILCDFKFNGWGLKFASDKDNLVTKRMCDVGLLRGGFENHLGFILEGGSIESDGRGSILTTSSCLLSPNRNGDRCKGEIEDYLMKSLGANRVMWLNHGYLIGDDTDSHIDTLARLVSEDTIVYVKCDNECDEHYDELHEMECELKCLTRSNGKPYNLIALPLPHPVYDSEGHRLPATYANFLITPKSVLLPIYKQPEMDELAIQILKVVFNDRVIVPIDCRALIQQHGSLHCMTMQLPHGILPI